MKYRTWLSVLALAALSAAPAAAQRTTVTFRGGLSLATLGGEGLDDADMRTGFNAGGALTFGVANNVGLLLGGAYVQKGASTTVEAVEATIALDYIEVPVMLSVSVPTGGPVVPRFAAGAAASFEASCKLTGETQGASASVDCGEADIATKAVDFGIIGGAGLSIGTGGTVSVTLDVLYNLGLASIDDSGADEDVKNRAWSFLAGIEIPIGAR